MLKLTCQSASNVVDYSCLEVVVKVMELELIIFFLNKNNPNCFDGSVLVQ